MSLTSYRAAPPRVNIVSGSLAHGAGGELRSWHQIRSDKEKAGRPVNGPPAVETIQTLQSGRSPIPRRSRMKPGSFRVTCGFADRPRVWKAWQRPTLPCLKTQYHWRRGFSRPSSEWDRVYAPRNYHQAVETRGCLRPVGRKQVVRQKPNVV